MELYLKHNPCENICTTNHLNHVNRAVEELCQVIPEHCELGKQQQGFQELRLAAADLSRRLVMVGLEEGRRWLDKTCKPSRSRAPLQASACC